MIATLQSGYNPWDLPWITGDYWDALIGITIAGAGVSAWAPVKGADSYTQGTDSLRAAYANGAVTGDGTDDYEATGAITLNQPFTMGVAFKMNALAVADELIIQSGAGLCGLYVSHSTFPGNFAMYAGTEVDSGIVADTTDWHIAQMVFNGASSVFQIDGTSASVNPGAGNGGAITIFNNGAHNAPSGSSIKGIYATPGALTIAQLAQNRASIQRRYGI